MKLHCTTERIAINGELTELETLHQRLSNYLTGARAGQAAVEAAKAARDDKRPMGGHHVDFSLDEVDGIEEAP